MAPKKKTKIHTKKAQKLADGLKIHLILKREPNIKKYTILKTIISIKLLLKKISGDLTEKVGNCV